MPISCSPSDLANAAYCFSSCGGDQMAIRSLLLQQFVPCVPAGSPPGTAPVVGCRAPHAPASLEVSNSPNNPGSSTITVDWTQPLNIPPVAATGYVVKWGTSSGNYNTGSAVIGPAPLAYTITGLSNSTTYFIVVYALNGLCVSGASNEIQGTTMSASGCAFATAWANRVVANGGAMPSNATQNAICAFQTGLVTDGLDVKMISWNAIVPDNLIAAITPQLVGPSGLGGGFDPWTNHNFVAGDLTINGLVGDGTTKLLDSGLAPNVIFTSPTTDGGVTIYAFTNPNATNCDVGVGNATQMSLQMYLGTTYWDSFDGVAGQGRISAANAGFTGYVSGNRIAANNTAIYEANSGTPHNTLVSGATSGGVLPTSTAFVFAFSTAGVASAWSNQRLSFVAFHHPLTSAQSQAFFNRIQALRTALGGGFT